MLRTFLLCLLLSLSLPAMAVYRCEAGGKITYSDQPCPGAKLVEVNTKVTPNESARAAAIASQEKAKLKRLENERHKREAMDEKERKQLARAAAAKQNRCRAIAQRKVWADEDAAAAAGKAHDKAKRRVRRITEQYEAECGPLTARL